MKSEKLVTLTPMLKTTLTATMAALLALSATACTDDEDGIDVPGPECAEVADVPVNWRAIGAVSSREVKTTVDGAVTTAIIDGTAGGFMMAADNPFIYLDLTKGARVDVSDVDAPNDKRWHLAFKRASVRVNGGDSGNGGVTVAKVEAAALADVTKAPADTEFATDDWASDACAYVGNDIGEPLGRLADWYVYDEATHRITGARPVVYVIKAGSAQFKLRIVSYYDEKNVSAMYKVEWAKL